MIGKLIAHYEVSARLGAGGMGEVYLARDTTLGREVALKLLPAEMSADETARARLINEARTASSLNHPHICTIYEVGEAEGRAYIAMEHVPGEALAAKIPEGGLLAETVVRYGEQVADALAHAHERGIIHRDLKTSNVMITPEGRVKVLDFGLAKKLRDEDLAEVTRSGKALTQAGAVVGTLHSMAPELLSGNPADARSDIWALGILLYETAAGALPFQGKTGFELTSAILREPPRTLSERMPAGLRAIIQNCLAKEPGQRYQRASEVRAALEAIRTDSVVTGARTDAVKPFWRRLSPLVWTVASALLLVGVGILVAVIRGVPFSIGLTRVERPVPAAPAGAGAPRSAGSSEAWMLSGRPSPNKEANEYLARAMLLIGPQFRLDQAQQMIEHALELDPKFASARASYALTFVLRIHTGFSNDAGLLYRAEQEARRTLANEPDSAMAHCMLGAAYLHLNRKEDARAELELCVKLDPNNIVSRTWIAIGAYHDGDYARTEEIERKVIEEAPLFFPARYILAEVLREQNRSREARREVEKILEQDPQNVHGIFVLARIHLDAGDLVSARAVLDRVSATAASNFRWRLHRALLLALERKRAEALRMMDAETLKYAEIALFAPASAAEFHAILGEKGKALDWLDRAIRNGDDRAEWFQRNPLLASIRQEPRFKQILDSIAYRREQRNKK
ncbi:MAG: protein kinase [Acidobacteria bacterium]|nr:protein kinase [Acidobacteriota bacterium]